MANEAQNRDQNFRSIMSIPGLSFDFLKWEYLMKGGLWKDAMTGGLQWTGIPGLRAVGLGANRNIKVGGGIGYSIGKGVVKTTGSLMEGVGNLVGSSRISLAGQRFGEQGIGGRVGRVLGGTRTPFLNVLGNIPETSRPAVTKALEKDWFGALFGNKSAGRETLFKRASRPGVIEVSVGGIATTSGNRLAGMASTRTASAAWKFAASKYIMPAAVWAGNFAFFASIAAPIFAGAGKLVSGGLESLETFGERLNRRNLDFGGKIHQSYMNRTGLTERQRALSELQRSRVNARTMIGNEAGLYHS